MRSESDGGSACRSNQAGRAGPRKLTSRVGLQDVKPAFRNDGVALNDTMEYPRLREDPFRPWKIECRVHTLLQEINPL